ncbi:calcium-binding protein, partial [Mesorhizobium sp. WSM4989]|nr:calcium-binding protein [Mesorhizobium sp. WSM4989]
DPVGTPTTPPTHVGTPAPTAPAPSGSDHVFHGTRGADVFHATGGNDKYLVNNAHDKVMEAPNGGFDKVAASVSYALTAGSHV